MDLTIVAVISLSTVGVSLAIILYMASQKFKVEENPLIDEVENVLPGANCGGCGFAGCRNFAEKCVSSESLESLKCPVGGNDTMSSVAGILGRKPVISKPTVAVLRCNGACEHRPAIADYNGASSCSIASLTSGGETACTYGCLGLADCMAVCEFDALKMDEATGLPVVNEDNCTSCGACVKACPKDLFEIRFKGPDDKRIFVACRNKDKGAVAKKSCSVACIGCGKCEKVCEYDAITINNDLAYIDYKKCELCRKCVTACPTEAIHETNFTKLNN